MYLTQEVFPTLKNSSINTAPCRGPPLASSHLLLRVGVGMASPLRDFLRHAQSSSHAIPSPDVVFAARRDSTLSLDI